jgi:uncharacterized membrane protein YdbT with pleckstrin-like domain
MGLPRRLLADGEYVQLRVHTHAKVMVAPAVLLILLGAATGFAVGAIPDDFQPVGSYLAIVVAVLLMILWCVVPFVRWRTTTYTLTNRRLITRSGAISKTGREMPLAWVADVGYRRSLCDRILGCGTLYLQPVGDGNATVLSGVPDLRAVHREISEQLFAEHRRAWNDHNPMVRNP